MLNYDEALAQLRAAGLEIETPIQTGRLMRCRVGGDREKRGWYFLREWKASNGDVLLVGSWGIAYGADPNAVRGKIELKGRNLSDAERDAFKKMLAEDRRRAEAARKAEAEDAAQKAAARWRELSQDGDSAYLLRKRVSGHGVRYTPEGEVAVPMADASGKLWGIQFIRPAKDRDGRDKDFWPAGLAKKGRFHLIGPPSWIVLVAEGYATAASLHAATQHPVAVAFDAGNLQPVAEALRKRYPKARILICADDDALARCVACKSPLRVSDGETCTACGKPHHRKNAGVEYASAAALAVSGAWVKPRFADEANRWQKFVEKGAKITDFNDLHAVEGLAPVLAQVESAIAAAGWSAPLPARGVPVTGGEGSDEIRPISTVEELEDRFAIIYGGKDVVFDLTEGMIVPISDMRNICTSRELHRRWAESPNKKIVREYNVGFDPTGKDRSIICNTFTGWPTRPKAGCCELLLDSLAHLCSAEHNSVEVYQWLLKWLAYPIQNPGAKMQSAIVVHGPQGAGKTQFFKAVGRIYGKHGLTIGQSAIENPRNTWLSSRLYILVEEGFARDEMYHNKNPIKDLITGETVYVDPKFVNPYSERNHVNLVFLSNEEMPVVLELDDRRHLVIYTPLAAQPKEFHIAVAREMEEGGVDALHDYLLNLPLGEFNPHTKPPHTTSKGILQSLAMDSTVRFFRDLTENQIEGITPSRCALTQDVYDLYRSWCGRIGVKPAPLPKMISSLERRHGLRVERKRYLSGSRIAGPHGICWIPEVAEISRREGKEERRLRYPEQPIDEPSETSWLGRQIEAFRNAVNDYKGARLGA